MAELTTQERLQPSLLDRLIDDEPDQSDESRERRVLSLSRLRESVLRDLGWLLNTTHLEVVENLDQYPYAAKSVLNFGLPELTGTSRSNLNREDIKRRLRESIIAFEPRLRRQTLDIRITHASDDSHTRLLEFEIDAELQAKPVSLSLFLKTEIDLESGTFEIIDAR